MISLYWKLVGKVHYWVYSLSLAIYRYRIGHGAYKIKTVYDFADREEDYL